MTLAWRIQLVVFITTLAALAVLSGFELWTLYHELVLSEPLLFPLFTLDPLLQLLPVIQRQLLVALGLLSVVGLLTNWVIGPRLRRQAAELSELKQKLEQQLKASAQHAEKLRRRIYHDSVTDLPNRAFFTLRLDEWMADAGQGALILCKARTLDVIHRQHGFQARDSALRSIANCLQQAHDRIPGALSARLSADEFVLLWPELDLETIKAEIDTLHEQLKKLQLPLGQIPLKQPWVAMGGALRLAEEQDGQALLARADKALQHAETQVTAHWLLCDSAEEIYSRQHWLERLRYVLQSGQLQLDMQPVLQTDLAQQYHNELLCRVVVDGDRRQPAQLFLPYVEQLEASQELDRWCLKQAIGLLKQHRKNRYAVNLSPASLAADDFMPWLARQLALLNTEQGLAERLALELPEHGLEQLGPMAEQFAELCRRYHVMFGIDQVGSSLQSLNYLYQLRPSYIKLNAHFLLPDSADPLAYNLPPLMDAMCRLAEGMEIGLILTHIESLAQIGDSELLEHVTAVQGYISPPRPLERKEAAKTLQQPSKSLELSPH